MAWILVVDDEDYLRTIFKEFLIKKHHQVLLATNGREALSLFNSYHVDLVLTDCVMPKMDGIELTAKIKEKNPHMPVIMITSTPPAEHRADVLLDKPVSLTLLAKNIDVLAGE